MDVDVWVRRAWLAVIPLAVVAVYFARSDPPEAPETALPSASAPPAVHDGLPSARPVSPSGSDLEKRGEAALAAPKVLPPDPVLPARPRKRAPRSRSAVDLAPADESGISSGERTQPLGPCGGIEARLITLSEDADWTFASLARPGEPAAIKHVGDRIGNWRVGKIEWDRVWLDGAGSRCAVGIHVGARAGADEVGGTETALDDPAPRRAAAWHVPREIANAIEKIATGKYAVERGIVSGLFETSGELLAGIRLTPLLQNETVTGVTLTEIREDSLLDRFGIANGDTLLSIDGAPIATLQGTLGALEKARKNERLLAKLERAGKRYELEIVAR